jgi:hypothetical protein
MILTILYSRGFLSTVLEIRLPLFLVFARLAILFVVCLVAALLEILLFPPVGSFLMWELPLFEEIDLPLDLMRDFLFLVDDVLEAFDGFF